MIKWIIVALCIVGAIFLINRYHNFLEANYERHKEESVSLKDAGKIINNVKKMKNKREEDIKQREKQFE